MKQSIRYIITILLVFLLTGCTNIALKAENLEEAIVQLNETFDKMEEKKSFTGRDQQILAEQISYFSTISEQ